jgi:hypothetical protein
MTETITGDAPVKEQPTVYTDIYQAPKHLRVFRSAKLSLKQINDLIADAYSNMLPVEEGVRDTEIPDFGNAKNRFQEAHVIKDGFWVERKSE